MGIKELKKIVIFLAIISFVFINLYIGFFEYNIQNNYAISSIPLIIAIITYIVFSIPNVVKSYIKINLQNKKYLQRFFNPFSNAYIILDQKLDIINYNDKFLEILDIISKGNYYAIEKFDDLNLSDELGAKVIESIEIVKQTKDKVKINHQIITPTDNLWFTISLIPFIFDDNNVYIGLVIKEYTDIMKLKTQAEETIIINNFILNLIQDIEKCESIEQIFLIFQKNIPFSKHVDAFFIFESDDLVYYKMLDYWIRKDDCKRVMDKYFKDKPVIIHQDCVTIDKLKKVNSVADLFPFLNQDDIDNLNNGEKHNILSYTFRLNNSYLAFFVCIDTSADNDEQIETFFNYLKYKILNINSNVLYDKLSIFNYENLNDYEYSAIIIDDNLKILYQNKFAQDELQFNEDKNLNDYLDKHSIEAINNIISEKVINQTLQIEFSNGEGQLFHYRLIMVPFIEGKKTKYLMIFINLDDYLKLKNDYRDIFYHYNAVFNNVPSLIVILDRNNTILSTNKVANEYFKNIFNVEKPLGLDFTTIVPKSSINDFEKNIKRAFKGEVIEFIKDFEIKGDNYTLKLKYQPIIDENGVVKNVLLIFNDLTNTKKLEEIKNEITFKNKFDIRNIPDPSIVMDLLGNIIYTNPQFEQELGFDENELVGKNISLIADKSFLLKLKKQYSTSNKQYISCQLKKKNQELSYFQLNSKLLEHGRIICTLRKEVSASQESTLLSKYDLLDAIINNLYSPIVVIDKNFNIIFKNKSFTKLFKDIETNSLKDYIPKSQYIEGIENLIEQKNFSKSEMIIKLREDMEETRVEILSFYDNIQMKYYFILIFSKVLASKEMIEQYKYLEKTYNNILDLVGDSFLILDENFNTTYLSDNLYKTFLSQDYKSNVNSIQDVLGEELSKQIIDILKSLDGKSYSFDIKFEKAGTDIRYFKVHLGKYEIDRKVKYYCFFENITNTNDYIEKIQHYEKLLLQEQFNYDVVIPKLAHKLHNYINSILGLLELLTEMDNITKENIEKYSSYVKNYSETVLLFFDKVVDYQLLEQKTKYNFNQNILVKDIINDLIYEVKDLVVDKNKIIKISLSNDSIKIKIVPEILFKIIKYLLFNKTMLENLGEFYIHISTNTNENNKLVVTFALSAQSKDVFTELINSLEHFDIANLDNFDHFAFDFYIAGKLLEKNNSKLVIGNDKNNQRVLYFSIPLEQMTTKGNKLSLQIDNNYFEEITINNTSRNDVKILIIEDNHVNIKMLENYLRDFAITFVDDLSGADEKIQEQTYDYIFTKLDFGETQQLKQFIKKIKSGKKKTVVVAVSGLSNVKHEELYDIGFDYLIQKPFNYLDFYKILGKKSWKSY